MRNKSVWANFLTYKCIFRLTFLANFHGNDTGITGPLPADVERIPARDCDLVRAKERLSSIVLFRLI